MLNSDKNQRPEEGSVPREGLWQIAVEAPLREPLTYVVPEELRQSLKAGDRVKVPLGQGQRKTWGVALSPVAQSPFLDLKAVDSVDSTFPRLPTAILQWLQWISHYYIYPIGLVVAAAYPPMDQKTSTRKSKRPSVLPPLVEGEISRPPPLTPEQSQVVNDIQGITDFSCHLIWGVTGSGKTEIYLQLLAETLRRRQRGLVLVPEIALTPQLIQRFSARFGNEIAVIHSHLTDREKTDQWWSVVDGRKKILIGARSALFCPIEDLGLIIIDEEHEPSYKQDEKLRYHARDSAIMRAKFANCPILLGSATPSLESWQNVLSGKFRLHTLKQRVSNRPLPEVQIFPLRGLKSKFYHPQLLKEMEETLARGEQVALFLNRRGTASVLLCPACGFSYRCPNCDISLTLHGRHHLVCHYCDFHESPKELCPDCKEGEMTAVGLGTEQLEKDMQTFFPEARVARADRDEIQGRLDLEDLIGKMEKGEIDILIGTQMIAKGLDFQNLTLVGLVLADVGFNLPDFRATERSFQLITQMSGRAGRHKPGKVIIQTLNPEHPSLRFAKTADFSSFAEQELSGRQALSYPPFGHLASFRIQGTQLDRVQAGASSLALRAQHLSQKWGLTESLEILGPVEAPIAKLRGKHRYQLLLKSHKQYRALSSFCRQLLGNEKWIPAGVRVSVDIDPQSLL